MVKDLVKRIYWRVIQSRLFNRFRPRITHIGSYLLKGKFHNNLDLAILIFADHENVVLYLSNLVYPQKPEVTSLGRTTYQEIPRVTANTNPDLVFAEFNGVFAPFFARSFLILPRVNFTLDIAPSWETVLAKMKRVRKRNIRKIKGYPYTYDVTKDPATFDFFYDQMYLPFISRTPEDSARLTPRALAKEWFNSGELTLVKSDGNYVAAVLHHPDNGSMHCRLVAYEDPTASQAGLYSVIKQAKERGFQEVNYGETPPFLRDGLFLYKRSWGMKMKEKLETAYAIQFCNFETPVQQFLRQNPFVFTNFKALVGLTLVDANNIDVNHFTHKYHTPGMNSFLLLSPQPEKTARVPASPLPREYGGLTSLRKLASTKKYTTQLVNLVPNSK